MSLPPPSYENYAVTSPQTTWSDTHIKHTVDSIINCLKILTYAPLIYNSTLQDSYPDCIYPCGITPNGTFTTSQPSKNIFELTKKSGSLYLPLDNYNNQFPYQEFFFQEISTAIISTGRQLKLYPCNITSSGEFLDFSGSRYPYGQGWDTWQIGFGGGWQFSQQKWIGSQFSPKFPYSLFFSGALINETSFKLHNLGNWTLVNKYMSRNQTFPVLYPWDIHPNGTFGKCPDNFKQPYGSFEHFPYKDFFSGNFSYKIRFVEQLRIHAPHYPSIEVTVLTSYWAFNSLAQLILVSPKSKSPLVRTLKILSLCVASSTFLASIVDLGWNIKWLVNTDESSALLGISALAVAYDSIYLTREIVSFASPWVREKVHQIAEKATKITGITRKGTMLQIDSTYQKSLQNTRTISGLLQLLLTGCIALTVISQYVFSDLHSHHHNLYSTQGIILAIFTGTIACLLLSFSYFSRRTH